MTEEKEWVDPLTPEEANEDPEMPEPDIPDDDRGADESDTDGKDDHPNA